MKSTSCWSLDPMASGHLAIAYGSPYQSHRIMDPMDPKPRLISAADRATSRGFHTKFGAVRRQAAHFLTKQERKSCQIAESVWLIIQSESTWFKQQLPLLEKFASADPDEMFESCSTYPVTRCHKFKKSVKRDRSNICSIFMAEQTQCRH